jgi:hypothetical protein
MCLVVEVLPVFAEIDLSGYVVLVGGNGGGEGRTVGNQQYTVGHGGKRMFWKCDSSYTLR